MQVTITSWEAMAEGRKNLTCFSRAFWPLEWFYNIIIFLFVKTGWIVLLFLKKNTKRTLWLLYTKQAKKTYFAELVFKFTIKGELWSSKKNTTAHPHCNKSGRGDQYFMLVLQLQAHRIRLEQASSDLLQSRSKSNCRDVKRNTAEKPGNNQHKQRECFHNTQSKLRPL